MFLKSLTLRGFKTFADKVEFQFVSEGGMTAVVGPNGCGKSNIVDAFRFALGEGNFRELRVNNLPEVIFAGTSLRKSLSLAEVSICFDNSSHLLPIEYAEVLVKRRTFKDSTSEFYINQQPCRLKDIRTLFLDTGISCESLSIIGQGRVDQVLTSRPEERRAFFEEVAGIHKYKTRKLEVERKLIICEQNLLRISDLKVEIGEQSVVLEAQAGRAREYRDIQSRLRAIELGVFKKQMQNILPRIEEIGGRISALKQKEQEISDSSRKAHEAKAQLREKIRRLDDQIESSHRAIEDIKEMIKNEQSSILIERERQIFSEKNKLRDLAEEERFIRFEMGRIGDSIKAIVSKKEEIDCQVREWAENNPAEFSGMAPLVELVIRVVEQLNKITKDLCGREGVPLRSQAEDRVIGLFRHELKKMEEDELSLADSLEAKNAQLRMVEAQKEELGRTVEGMERTTVSARSEEIDRLERQAGEQEDLLGRLKEEKNNDQKTLDELERQPSGSASDIGELMREEISLARMQAELAQIEERVQSEYNMEREELLAQDMLAENVARSKKEADELRARLRMLEPVNLLAIDEYEKVKERHAFIESQFNDLEAARDNLKSLIAELDQKASQDFARTMEIITVNFKQIFASLFDGGEATIEVDQNEGIEISVCPSGRKWLNLSLLSGGEKSLTAIALLLSFLRTQPSPLCILDEVDAALDEANVARFAKFIKEFSGRTQIIVITHNKRTMEAADVIYGITMEEPGVSKVVSMKLETV